MKSLQKMLAEQKKQQTNINLTLEKIYKEYGEALFEYALKNRITEDSRFFSATDAWKKLKEERTTAADSIVTMKAALARQKEVEQFYHESEKMLNQHTKRCKQLQEQFAVAFFRAYEDDETMYFLASIKEKNMSLRESAEKLEEQQVVLEEQRETSSTMKKLLISSQLTVLRQKLNRLKKIKDKKVIDDYTAITNDPSVQRAFAKIQSISKKSLYNIKNTAWDILHIRLAETQMIDDFRNEKIYFHYIGTRDVGLQNIININPLKIIGFLDEQPVIVRENNINDILTDKVIDNMLLEHQNKKKICGVNYKKKFEVISYQIANKVNKYFK